VLVAGPARPDWFGGPGIQRRVEVTQVVEELGGAALTTRWVAKSTADTADTAGSVSAFR
jgi:hypothetical protein